MSKHVTNALTILALLPMLGLAVLARPEAVVAQNTVAEAPINTYNALHHPVVGRSGMVASQNFLEQTGEVSYNADGWSSLARVQAFQTLDSTIAPENRPYKRLPQLYIAGDDRRRPQPTMRAVQPAPTSSAMSP